MSIPREAVERAIRSFNFGNYGLNDVDIALHDHPEHQEWVPDLASAIIRAIEKASEA